ncbi:ribonuclease D [Alloscardovia theropitheci]|uniref:Ribonuclease D n=1 Tax=Alloscardovia theropitheci TaxID=2496842 RepID=A0A4R0QWL2_9BIFI|nr:HRDC domain-containing protein [Alloscardovia theropitheci]TCD54817.1 ribonuclease D [Alloscardovia theropitheci]
MSEKNDDIRLLAEPAGGVPDVIRTRQQFDTFIHSYEDSYGPLAADAERASGFRYGHRDYLVQFKRAGAPIALLDPIALQEERVDWQAFNALICGDEWIIHDSLQDIPGFKEIGFSIDKLFDTEHAARLLGLKRFGLSAVTEHYLHVTLAKEHSAADWSYRPLNRDLRNYAALDVEILIELREALIHDLKQTGKLEWAYEDFEYLRAKGLKEKEPHPQPWRKVSHITRLSNDARGLAIVQELWTEREKLAQELDIAPTLLLSDAGIIEAAVRKPKNTKEFSKIKLLNDRVRVQTDPDRAKMFERYAAVQRQVKPKVWKDAIERALDKPYRDVLHDTQQIEKEGTSAPRSMKYWREHHPDRFERLKNAKGIIGQISQDTHTPVEILLKPQVLRNLCWQDDIKEDLESISEFLTKQGVRNWQVELLAPSLSKVII